MIVNIRGTGGAGKSTVVRTVMEMYGAKTPAFKDGRKQPVGYLLMPKCICAVEELEDLHTAGCASRVPLWIPGHYETPCGGCDTITKVDDVFASVREHAQKGYDVLFEGIISQDDTTRTLELAKDFDLLVLHLDTPVPTCLEGIQARRDARGDARPLNPKNTEARARSVTTRCKKLKAAGLNVEVVSRATAASRVLAELWGEA